MQDRLEGVLCRGRSTGEDEILSHWRIRNWLREEETLELGLEGLQGKDIPSKGRARTKTQASIRLGIFGIETVPTSTSQLSCHHKASDSHLTISSTNFTITLTAYPQ